MHKIEDFELYITWVWNLWC